LLRFVHSPSDPVNIRPRMLLSSLRSAERFSPAIAFGLRSLLVPQPSGGIVVTRVLAAASRCGAGVHGRRDGTNIGAENAKTAEEDEGRMHDEVEDGLWVSYGRREPRRRLPPPIPSLLARGALRRTRTNDGRRLVIVIAPVAWPECTRSRRRSGRLTMQLIEHDDNSPLTTRSFPAPTIRAREDDDNKALEEPDDDTYERVDKTAPAIESEEGIDCVQEAADVATAQGEMLQAVAPPRVPSAGCFEDVFKYGSVGGSSLHLMPASLIRTVH
jgi:hypothetical protein